MLRKVSGATFCATLKIMKSLSLLLLTASIVLTYLLFNLFHLPTVSFAQEPWQCPSQVIIDNSPIPNQGQWQCIDRWGECTIPLYVVIEQAWWEDCVDIFNKCGEVGLVAGPFFLVEEEMNLPDYCLGGVKCNDANVAECNENRPCITQEQLNYCNCLENNYWCERDGVDCFEICDEPDYIPTPIPTPTPTPDPLRGTYSCIWVNGQCFQDIDSHSCVIGEGYMPCDRTCEEFNSEGEDVCNAQVDLTCERVFECYPDLDPWSCEPARCEVGYVYEEAVITLFCEEDNSFCRTALEDVDGVPTCRCFIPGSDRVCCALGVNFSLVPRPRVFCYVGSNDPNQRTDNPASGKIASAIGCIPVNNTAEFVGYLLRWSMGIAGGIAFILIVYAGFIIVTSAGSPQKIQAGKELLTAAVTGLMVLIFGAFILEFIGFTILNIPGFGGESP